MQILNPCPDHKADAMIYLLFLLTMNNERRTLGYLSVPSQKEMAPNIFGLFQLSIQGLP